MARPAKIFAGLAVYGPLALLLLVLANQLNQRSSNDLSHWKGGGFGMFSVVEKRVVRLSVVTDKGREVPVPSSSVGDQADFESAAFLPRGAAETRLLHSLAEQEWYDDGNPLPDRRRRPIALREVRLKIYAVTYQQPDHSIGIELLNSADLPVSR